MEAAGDGVWERVYDGINRAGVLTFTATGLHASLMYRFRVYAVNRVGASAESESSVRISDRTPPGLPATHPSPRSTRSPHNSGAPESELWAGAPRGADRAYY